MFHPFLGQVADTRDDNIAKTKDGSLKIRTPPLACGNMSASKLENGKAGQHPITGVDIRYMLADELTKDMKRDVDKLRDCSLVPQLCGVINTRTAEQTYSLNYMD